MQAIIPIILKIINLLEQYGKTTIPACKQRLRLFYKTVKPPISVVHHLLLA